MTDGSTKTKYYSNTTTVSKQQTAAASDLATGATVRVNGTPHSDGSVTAQSISIQPIL